MSMLDKVTKPQDRPIIATVTGDAGIGKTSLAATFPKPIFIRSEDGLQAIPYDQRPDAFPEIAGVDDLREQIKTLMIEEHDYKTLVIDSITKLDSMFARHIVDSDPKKPASINQALGGYGAGLQALGQMHQGLRSSVELLNKKRGMHIVFIAHADTVTVEPPDSDPYTRYDLRLQKRSVSPYVDDVDLVAYIKLETFTRGDGERKQAISTGARSIITYTSASNISKNRYGITEPVPFEIGVNPFIGLIPALSNQQEIK